MKDNNGISLQDYWTVLRRRRFLMTWVFLGVLLAVASLTFVFPEQYRSAAYVRIDSPDIQDGLVNTTVQTPDREMRIDRMRERVVSNSKLEPLIEEFSLYLEYPPEERPARMRSDIDTPKVLNTNDPRMQFRGPEIIGFEVAYLHGSPETAQLVARRLAQLFLEENVASRTETVSDTSDFLARQAADVKAELARTEDALAAFKQRHAGSLPDDAGLNLQRLDRAQNDLDGVEREIRTLQERKNMLMVELANTSPSATLYSESGDPILGTEERLELLRREFVSLAARYTPEHPNVVRLRREIELLSDDAAATLVTTASLQTELDAKREELTELRQRYADDHPDVRRLEVAIGALQDNLDAAPAPGSAEPVREPNNPAYVQLQVRLEGVDTELAALRADRETLRGRIGEYEARLTRAPEIERELLGLTRDYEIAVRDYNEIRDKQLEAERAIVTESQQRAERYVLQRNALLPDSPAEPSHLTLALIGTFLGLTMAIGVGLLREALDTTVRGARDLRTILETRPIAVVPSIETKPDLWRRLLRRISLAVSFAAVAFFTVSAAA